MNEPRYLITQSLLSAWLYQYNCAEGYEEAAREEFIETLNRKPFEQNVMTARGNSFENAVYEMLRGDDQPAYEHCETYAKRNQEKEFQCIVEVAKRVRGGAYQLTEYKDKTIAGVRFLLMAKCDWVKAGVILDCKRVEKYHDVGKYLNSVQHPMYLEVIQTAREFKYIICDGEDVYEERYTRMDIPQDIDSIIMQFIDSLKSDGLWETYTSLWKSKY
jgi:hypothetical protein